MSKLVDKAKGIRFDDAGEPAPPAPVEVDRPRTAIGAISASLAMGRGLEAENRELKASLKALEDASVVEMLDPHRIRPSRYANRHESSFSGPEFRALKHEIASAGGNVQPIKVRPLPGGEGQGGHEGPRYEIAYGHRRHRACLELGLPVAAVVESLIDAELFAEMDRENRDREDLSPWEQGVMYKRALDLGLFPTLRRLAEAVGAQPGNVSTAVQLASLPEEVVAAFQSPLVLQYRWAAAIKGALDRDAKAVLTIAAELAAMQPKLPAKEVLERLTGAQASTARGAPRQFIVGKKVVAEWDKDAKGHAVLRIRGGALEPDAEQRLLDFVEGLFGASTPPS